MNSTGTSKVMNILIWISLGIIIIGSIFKIQHYPYGSLLLTGGFLAYIVFSSVEIQRLKQIIKDKEY